MGDQLALVVLLGLAAYRATRIVTADSISESWRTWLYRQAWEDQGPAADPAPRSVLRTYIWEGFTCPFCVGVWCALVLVTMWVGWPWSHWHGGRWLLLALAVAGVQAFVHSRKDA